MDFITSPSHAFVRAREGSKGRYGPWWELEGKALEHISPYAVPASLASNQSVRSRPQALLKAAIRSALVATR